MLKVTDNYKTSELQINYKTLKVTDNYKTLKVTDNYKTSELQILTSRHTQQQQET